MQWFPRRPVFWRAIIFSAFGPDHCGGGIISLIAFFATWLLLKKWVAKEWIAPNEEFVRGLAETDSDKIDDILIKDEKLPNTFLSFLPLLLPVFLISLSSFAAMYLSDGSLAYKV